MLVEPANATEVKFVAPPVSVTNEPAVVVHKPNIHMPTKEKARTRSLKVLRNKAGAIDRVLEEAVLEEKGVEETVTRSLKVNRDRAGAIDSVIEEATPDARLGGQLGRR